MTKVPRAASSPIEDFYKVDGSFYASAPSILLPLRSGALTTLSSRKTRSKRRKRDRLFEAINSLILLLSVDVWKGR